jgi:hypothetical protein
MEGFDHILNWKLLPGSHEFPGKDGGTCINEAAVVAAGFDYRPIRHIAEMPPCFSRPICLFAMYLNDFSNDVDRQRLLPYVARLACADTDEIEHRRQSYISSRMMTLRPLAKGIEILEGALAIGRQAEPLEFPAVEARMSAVKEKAGAATPKTNNPLLATMKQLLSSL